MVKWQRHLRPHNYLGPELDPGKEVVCPEKARRGRVLRSWPLEELRSQPEATTQKLGWRRNDSEQTEGQDSDKGRVTQDKP